MSFSTLAKAFYDYAADAVAKTPSVDGRIYKAFRSFNPDGRYSGAEVYASQQEKLFEGLLAKNWALFKAAADGSCENRGRMLDLNYVLFSTFQQAYNGNELAMRQSLNLKAQDETYADLVAYMRENVDDIEDVAVSVKASKPSTPGLQP